eukprot:CAMPEP_0114498690 /NCGR_PEP_ID=MMETSP0109-20121206/7007_1 /TAXON_ID=29199 /ORGANISM="Chlorarachnion reptans, Strain CCCM449" /LENGTH=241 /DNA_ID=CAMNT_0001676185 /DNA_START=370 /DNA_END=1095 /DNA_ORIENTATION=+
MTSYFNASPSNAYVIGVHPHGVAADYRACLEGLIYDMFPAFEKCKRGWRTLAASILFWLPLVREVVLWTGCVDAGRLSANKVLKEGNSVIVLPGGEAEQIRTTYGEERLYLKNRMGFVALAVDHGAALVPVYVFGASDAHYTSHRFFNLREMIRKRFKICLPLFWGDLGVASRRVKHTLVFGDPMKVTKYARPGKDASEIEKKAFRDVVAKVHAEYIERLVKVFEDHKVELGYGDRNLIIQ